MRLAFPSALLSAVLLAITLVLAPGVAHATEVMFPRGSAIGLVPPPGMVESSQFSGFEDAATKASILIVDMPADAYDQLEAGFNEQALATRGEPRNARDLPHQRRKGAAADRPADRWPRQRSQVGSAGGERIGTGIVTVQVPEAEANALPDAAVRAAFSSITFRSVADQAASLPFAVTNMAGFRPVRALGGTTLLLTDGPKDVVDGPEQPVFVVSIAGGAPRDDERRQFALRALSSIPGVKDLKLDRAEPQRISGQAGFEVMATGADARTGAPVKVVQWIRFGPTAYIRMVGVTKLDAFPDVYDRLRALRDGVEGR